MGLCVQGPSIIPLTPDLDPTVELNCLVLDKGVTSWRGPE